MTNDIQINTADLDDMLRLFKVMELSNDSFKSLLLNDSRYLILKGGGGSGKSIFTGMKLLLRLTTEKGHRILVCRKVARTLRESCFQQLKSQISQYYNYSDFEINKTDMTIKYTKNGNEVIFAGLDDVEKLKSIYNITSIWIEEASELDEQDFQQLDIRLRGETENYKQIILTFNPIDIGHWLKKKFFDELVEDSTVHESTYKDNRFLDDEAIKVLEGFKETDPYYYDVYCLGNWGILGSSIFDKNKIGDRLRILRERKPLKIGYFEYDYDGLKITNIRWVDDDNGYIQIYVDRIPLTPYVVGADTSGEGSDYFIGQVINNTSGEQVATLRQQFDEDLFVKQIYCLGQYYNWALLGLETNFSTYPTNELQRLSYPKMYMREVQDSITHKIEKRFGFKTTTLTRPIIIADLVRIVRENIELFNDITTLEEMLTFARNESGKACAIDGAHDDCVMAMAITYYVRTQQSYSGEEEPQVVQKKWIDTVKPKKKQGLL
jgi:phage terminase large subunit